MARAIRASGVRNPYARRVISRSWVMTCSIRAAPKEHGGVRSPPSTRRATRARPRRHTHPDGAVKQRKHASNTTNVPRPAQALKALLDRRRQDPLPALRPSPHPRKQHRRPIYPTARRSRGSETGSYRRSCMAPTRARCWAKGIVPGSASMYQTGIAGDARLHAAAIVCPRRPSPAASANLRRPRSRCSEARGAVA